MINEKDNEISSLCQAKKSILAESRQISASKCAEIADLHNTIETLEQDAHAFYEKELKRYRNSVADLEKRIQEYEAAKAEAFLSHKKTTELLWQEKHEIQCNKDRELCQQREACTALQDEIRSLNESRDRELADHKAALDAANAETQRVIHDKEQELRDQREDDVDEIYYLFEEVHDLQEQMVEMKDIKTQEIDAIEQRLAEEYEDIISGLDKAREGSFATREAEYLNSVASCYATDKKLGEELDTMRAKLAEAQDCLVAEQASYAKLRDDLHTQKTEHDRAVACLKEEVESARASIDKLEAVIAEEKSRTESLENKQQTAQSVLAASQMELETSSMQLVQEYEARLEQAAKDCQKQLSARDAQLRAAKASIESLSISATKVAGGGVEHQYIDPELGFGQFYADGKLPISFPQFSDSVRQESTEELQLQLAHAQETAREAVEKLEKLHKVHKVERDPSKSPRRPGSSNKNDQVEPASPKSPVSSRKSRRRAKKEMNKNDGMLTGDDSGPHMIQGQVCP